MVDDNYNLNSNKIISNYNDTIVSVISNDLYIEPCSTTIKNEVSKNYQQENIIHEILHALLDNAGLPEENLDKTIQILTPRIHAFLIDNIEFQKNFLEFEKNEDNI